MHHAKNVAKSIISDSKSVLCINCMLHHKIVVVLIFGIQLTCLLIYSALFCIDWIREIVVRMTVTVKWENFQESTQGLVINLLEQEKLLLRFCPCYCVNFLRMISSTAWIKIGLINGKELLYLEKLLQQQPGRDQKFKFWIITWHCR